MTKCSRKHFQILTIGCEQISVIYSNAENIFLEVFDGELHGGVPFWVQCVVYHFGTMFLDTHAHFTVRIAFSYELKDPRKELVICAQLAFTHLSIGIYFPSY